MSCPDFALRYSNLASPRFGTEVVSASDEFFAPKNRMLQDSEPIFIADKYDEHGKWMDGWETRRRRDGGHDHCIIRLGAAGVIHGVDIDTRHFTGNYPPAARLEGACGATPPTKDDDWIPLIPRIALGPDAHHYAAIDKTPPLTWLRLSLYPDGGIARLRLYGEVVVDWQIEAIPAELSSMRLGGRVVAYNNAHFGDPAAILAPGRGRNMGDGWETRRRREPGHDWLIVALACPGIVTHIDLDTAHFKGNFPDQAGLKAAFYDPATAIDDAATLTTRSMFWPTLLSPQKLAADSLRRFETADLALTEPISHVRIDIYPDGGVSRLRIFGTPVISS